MPARAALLALAAIAALAGPTIAQDAKPAAVDKPIELTPEEIAEREGRKACKVAICAAFHNRKPGGGDIACNVVKSWRKEQLEKSVSKAKLTWPWGRVKCTADIKLKREFLIKALVEPKHEAQIDTHRVACEIEREKEDKAEIKFELAPKVTFEGGKATKAVLGWGKIEAPAIVKGAMWTATATDNAFNVMQGSVIEDINDFVGAKCDEVKDEWQGK